MMSLESNLCRLKSRIFLKHGRKPYARGYVAYRQLQLQQYLDKALPDRELPEGWGLWLDERVVEYPWFLSRLPQAPGKLLDAGSVLNHDYVLSHRMLSNKTISILTLAPESQCHWHRGISYVYGDLRECCYRDDYFDWIVSISTLEHVGMNNTRFYTTDSSKNECRPDSHLKALLELRRILRVGGTLYLTLPYGRAQNRGWLQIFDADGVARLLDAFRPASLQRAYFRYTQSGWQYSLPDECRDARYFDQTQGENVRTEFAAAEAIVCLELVK